MFLQTPFVNVCLRHASLVLSDGTEGELCSMTRQARQNCDKMQRLLSARLVEYARLSHDDVTRCQCGNELFTDELFELAAQAVDETAVLEDFHSRRDFSSKRAETFLQARTHTSYVARQRALAREKQNNEKQSRDDTISNVDGVPMSTVDDQHQSTVGDQGQSTVSDQGQSTVDHQHQSTVDGAPIPQHQPNEDGTPSSHHTLSANTKSCDVIPQNRHVDSYERLEFVGDAVVAAVVSVWLCRSVEGTELTRKVLGRLTARRGEIVSNAALSRAAFRANLIGQARFGSEHLARQVASGEKIKIAGSLYEAHVAALYLCDGFSVAADYIEKTLLATDAL